MITIGQSTKSVTGPLCHITNLSIKTCTVPSTWKIAKMLLAFKSGQLSVPENYQTSILPTL